MERIVRCGECVNLQPSRVTDHLNAYIRAGLPGLDLSMAEKLGADILIFSGLVDKLQELKECGGYLGVRVCSRFRGDMAANITPCEDKEQFISAATFGINRGTSN